MKKLIRITLAAITLGLTAGIALAAGGSVSNGTTPPPPAADGSRAAWAG